MGSLQLANISGIRKSLVDSFLWKTGMFLETEKLQTISKETWCAKKNLKCTKVLGNIKPTWKRFCEFHVGDTYPQWCRIFVFLQEAIKSATRNSVTLGNSGKRGKLHNCIGHFLSGKTFYGN